MRVSWLGEVGDVARDQLGRMLADLEGKILGVDAEGIEADRLEDLVPLHPLEATEDIGAGEGEEIADVQPLGGGVGEHHQVVERPLGPVEVGLVGAALPPAVAPLALDVAREVALGVGGVVGHGPKVSGRRGAALAGVRMRRRADSGGSLPFVG